MKILFVHSVSPFEPLGGAEVSLQHLTQALVDQGHECVVLVTGRAGAGRGPTRRTMENGVVVVTVALQNLYPLFDGRRRPAPVRLAWHAIDRFNPLMKSAAADVIERERPDVASVHNLAGWSAAVWEALAAHDVPFVQVLHDQYALCASSMMFRGTRNCQSRCLSCRLLRLGQRQRSHLPNAVVGVSRFVLERHLSYGLFTSTPHRYVIHNARAPDQIQRQGSPSMNADDRRALRFGFIGSINPSKGTKQLTDAFSALTWLDAELWIAGDLKTDYARQLAGDTTDPRVQFKGRMAPDEFYNNVDVVVLPSVWHDTFPGVAFEALIFGRPVIATNRGGAPEIIHDGHNGLIFDSGEPGALAECLERLACDPTLRIMLSEQAYRDGVTYLDVAGWAERYADIYRQLVAATTFDAEAPAKTVGARRG